MGKTKCHVGLPHYCRHWEFGGYGSRMGFRRNVNLISDRWAWVEVLCCRAYHTQARQTDSNHWALNLRASVCRTSFGQQKHPQSLFAIGDTSSYLLVIIVSRQASSQMGHSGLVRVPLQCSHIFQEICHSFFMRVVTQHLPVLRRCNQL